MSNLRTTGKSIVISGGSRGLGLHLCQAFLEAGNCVATFARHETPAIEGLRSHGERFRFESLDATNGPGVERFVKQVRQAFGSIDGLINNAAIGQDELLIHTPVEKVNDIIATNVVAPETTAHCTSARITTSG